MAYTGGHLEEAEEEIKTQAVERAEGSSWGDGANGW